MLHWTEPAEADEVKSEKLWNKIIINLKLTSTACVY